MAKPTKKQALDKLASLPNFPKPTKVTALPPPLRPIAVIPYVFDQGAKALARGAIEVNLGNRIDNSKQNRIRAGEVTMTELVEQQEIINNPNIIMDEIGDLLEIIEPLRDTGRFAVPTRETTRGVRSLLEQFRMDEPEAPKKKRKPSEYNKRYAAAFKKVAPRFKKKNGGWKKDGFKRAGAAARKIAKKPKRRSTRKGQVRKTARRAFE